MTSESDINEFLYNWHKIQKHGRIIVTEGVLDAWRTGDDAVATFGTSLSDTQRIRIRVAKPTELVFCWDPEAWSDAYYEAMKFTGHADIIKVVKLPDGMDPDELGREKTLDCIRDDKWIIRRAT
jgi:DNA primase